MSLYFYICGVLVGMIGVVATFSLFVWLLAESVRFYALRRNLWKDFIQFLMKRRASNEVPNRNMG